VRARVLCTAPLIGRSAHAVPFEPSGDLAYKLSLLFERIIMNPNDARRDSPPGGLSRWGGAGAAGLALRNGLRVRRCVCFCYGNMSFVCEVHPF
jgi:hypothetical protein